MTPSATIPPRQASGLDEFLRPLSIDVDAAHVLSQRFLATFDKLSAESADQFLPTPISESILRPIGEHGSGRHLAIDIGGTNLRVGFVEIVGRENAASQQDAALANGVNGSNGTSGTNGTSHPVAKPSGRVQRLLERSWPIDEHLKIDNADSLFRWIGKCIAEVVREGCQALDLPADEPLALGVTFSFPMVQHSVSEATLMSMGKGFAIPPNTNLGTSLQEGYMHAKGSGLPPIQVAAIANDSVSTLISFIFKYDESRAKRASMGLILGTGCNATLPLKLSRLHRSKRPANISVLPGESVDNVKISVNTELSINGTAPPVRELGLVSRWDKILDSENEIPGFQPLEYMTAGRYLGELGRIMLIDYMTSVQGLSRDILPAKLLVRHGLTTTFLSHFKPLHTSTLLAKLQGEFPESTARAPFVWTEHLAEALYRIAKAIEVRAAGIIAAAVLGLLTLAEEIPLDASGLGVEPRELGVGYTGGCIVHFQEYLVDCQKFIDRLVERRFGSDSPVRVVLSPCHDGGITGAGILVAAALSSKNTEM